MFAGHDLNSLTLVTLIIAALGVFFWRTVIKLVAIGAATMVMLGLFEFLSNIH